MAYYFHSILMANEKVFLKRNFMFDKRRTVLLAYKKLNKIDSPK